MNDDVDPETMASIDAIGETADAAIEAAALTAFWEGLPRDISEDVRLVLTVTYQKGRIKRQLLLEFGDDIADDD